MRHGAFNKLHYFVIDVCSILAHFNNGTGKRLAINGQISGKWGEVLCGRNECVIVGIAFALETSGVKVTVQERGTTDKYRPENKNKGETDCPHRRGTRVHLRRQDWSLSLPSGFLSRLISTKAK